MSSSDNEDVLPASDTTERVVLVSGHANNILDSMNELRSENVLCDVTIKCQDVELPAHRVVLAASSSYFRAMFTTGMREKDQSVVEIKGMSSNTVIILLNFVYTESVKVTTNNVQDLLPAACLLQLKGVEQACCAFLKSQLDPVNCLSIKSFASTHQCLDLAKCAEEFTLKHFKEVIENEEFLELNESDVIELLESSELEIDSEEDVYEALIYWITHNREERGPKLSNMLEYVRLPLLSAQFITDVLDEQELIKSNLRCRDLLDAAKKFHLRPELRAEMQGIANQPRYGTSEVLIVLGGFGSQQAPIPTVEKYNPKTGEWGTIASFTKRRRYVSAVTIDNRIYVIGGYDSHLRLNTVECLEYSSDDDGIWYSVAPMHMKRGLAGATVLGNLIYVAGGFDGSSRHSCAERYDPRIDEWAMLPDMACAREGAGLVTARDCIYCVGGYDGVDILSSVELYDPKVGKWIMVSRMNTKRSGAGVAYLNHVIYVLGGFNGNFHLDTVEAYNVHTDCWTEVQQMTVPRCYVNACVLRGKLHAVAGYDGHYLLNSIEQYDPEKDDWKVVTHMSTHRCDAGITVIKEKT
uniref:kelch-like protein 12 n=1 Tax=Styela clava TaxID=7725 RepID=UPI001939D6EE|nr:kelch-like protein 12 [Styela clava]